jgi:hypothetical protein
MVNTTLLAIASLALTASVQAQQSTTLYTDAEVLAVTGEAGKGGWSDYYTQSDNIDHAFESPCLTERASDEGLTENDGVWGLKWMTTEDTDGNLEKYLEYYCTPTEPCYDIDTEGCATFFTDAKQLMDLLGWDGYTSIAAVYDQVEDRIPEEEKTAVNEDTGKPMIEEINGETYVAGYRLKDYRIGDLCPVSANMCEDTVKVSLPIPDGADAASFQEKMLYQACVVSSNLWEAVDQTSAALGAEIARPDLAGCRFASPAASSRRRLAGSEMSVEGDLADINLLLFEMATSGGIVEALAADPNAGFDIINPDAKITTDKKTNEGGLTLEELIMYAAVAVLGFLCLCCCCCCWCCKCCCFKKAKVVAQ